MPTLLPHTRCASELPRDCRRYRSDSAAVDFSSPGTVVITTGFIGYLVAAAAGVARAAITVFVAPCLVVTVGSLHYRRFAKKLAGEGVRSGRDAGSGGSDRGS
jgi:chromate transporter